MTVNAGNVSFGNELPLVLISGPCQLENESHALELGGRLAEICADLGIGYVFKASYDKANRSSIDGERGPGKEAGLAILKTVGERIGCPVLTDVHTAEDCAIVAEGVDILQIPAFLSRQTDLLVAAGKTGRVVNVKKGQFLAPWDMKNVVKKIESSGNSNILLTERGASFGYNMLVSDMRSLPIMAETGYPVVFDATHSVQLPGGLGTSSGGQSQFVPVLARAAVAAGCASVFIETHEDPSRSPSDGPNMVRLADMPVVLEELVEIDRFRKARRAAG